MDKGGTKCDGEGDTVCPRGKVGDARCGKWGRLKGGMVGNACNACTGVGEMTDNGIGEDGEMTCKRRACIARCTGFVCYSLRSLHGLLSSSSIPCSGLFPTRGEVPHSSAAEPRRPESR